MVERMQSPETLVSGNGPFGVLTDEDRAALMQAGRRVALPEGARAFEPGQAADAFLVVLAGSVKVQLTGENGREIVLYRVSAGESCVLTTSCLLASEPYAAEAICESDVVALAVPRSGFRHLLDTVPGFRDALLSAYAARVSDLILTIEDTRFRRVDARLAALLLSGTGRGPLAATHQALATELGSAREVVSRILKRYERAGLISLSRGMIEIKDRARLHREAQSV